MSVLKTQVFILQTAELGLEGTAKLFLLLRNTLVRPLDAGQIEGLKAAFKMEF